MAQTKDSTSPLAAHASAPINQNLTVADKVNLYRQMVRIRRFEQVSLQHYQAGRMGGALGRQDPLWCRLGQGGRMSWPMSDEHLQPFGCRLSGDVAGEGARLSGHGRCGNGHQPG